MTADYKAGRLMSADYKAGNRGFAFFFKYKVIQKKCGRHSLSGERI